MSDNRNNANAGADDPLLAAINHYIFSGDAYETLPEDLAEEQEAEEFIRLGSEPEKLLLAWRSPARTRESAVAALRLALTELEVSDGEPIVVSLVRAALGYFDRAPDAGSQEEMARSINRHFDTLIQREKTGGRAEAIEVAEAETYAAVAFLDQAAGRQRTMALLGGLVQSS